MKICSICKIEKENSDFNKKTSQCRNCKKIYYELNKEKINKKDRLYREQNNEKIKNKDKIYYENNKEIIISRNVKYAKNNKEKIRENNNIRRKNDPIFKIRKLISSAINDLLKSNKSSKNGISCSKYFLYTMQELKDHLESKFESWMNWNNHGLYVPSTWDDNDATTWIWNIDHIIPQSKLLYVSMEDENFKICWSLDNLRPYSAKQNILDGNRR